MIWSVLHRKYAEIGEEINLGVKIPKFIVKYHRDHPNSRCTPEESYRRYLRSLRHHFILMKKDAAYRKRKISVGLAWQRQRAKDPNQLRYMLYQKAMRRAKKFGIKFAISPDDIIIPVRCPVLGFKLKSYYGSAQSGRGAQNTHYDSYSLDRIKPRLGYVPGNIAVISHRANTLKRNASLKEIEKLFRWMRKITQ